MTGQEGTCVAEWKRVAGRCSQKLHAEWKPTGRGASHLPPPAPESRARAPSWQSLAESPWQSRDVRGLQASSSSCNTEYNKRMRLELRPHFTDGETEAWKQWQTFPSSPRWLVAELGCESPPEVALGPCSDLSVSGYPPSCLCPSSASTGGCISSPAPSPAPS